VVLYAAMGSVRDERVAEIALMRALGASRRQLGLVQLLELSLTGLLAGLRRRSFWDSLVFVTTLLIISIPSAQGSGSAPS